MSKQNIAGLLKENKAVVIIIAIVLILVELEIFAVALMKSGEKSMRRVYNKNGSLIYETNAKTISDFNKYYFEKNFGPLDQYEIRVEKVKGAEFSFKDWFFASVGIPIGMVLLFSFIVKAYVALFYEESRARSKLAESDENEYETRLEKTIASVSRFNIFAIGLLIFLCVFAMWAVPEVMAYLAKVGEETILKYKWFFLAVIVSVSGFIIWVVYLRYRLAEKTLESQVEVDKYRLQLQIAQSTDTPLQLEYEKKDRKRRPRPRPVDLKKDDDVIDAETEVISKKGRGRRSKKAKR